MELAKGFCDLNIAAATNDLKQTVLKALSIGYQTIAINTEVTDTTTNDKKKKKKGILNWLLGMWVIVTRPPEMKYLNQGIMRI